MIELQAWRADVIAEVVRALRDVTTTDAETKAE